LLAEDDDAFAEALATLHEADGRFEIGAHARDGADAVGAGAARRPLSERALEARLVVACDYVRKSRVTSDLVEALVAAGAARREQRFGSR
jgi:hypothetical protein